MARPSEYSDDIAATICERMAGGESLRQICSDPVMPAASTVVKWKNQRASFREQYARAREDQADYWADLAMEVAFDGSGDIIVENGRTKVDTENVHRSRLKVDTIKWRLAKLWPKRFGDNPVEEDAVASQKLQISWIKTTIVDPKPAEPEAPRLLTYQQPLPADLSPEDWTTLLRVLDAIKRHCPADNVPRAAEVFGAIEEALSARFGNN